MTRPTITVVIPAHPARMRNGKLQRALQSVYDQTRPADAVSLAIDVDGEGAAPTRHRALMAARTDWVAFLDSDDLFLPKHLEWLIGHAVEAEADFVYSWFKVLQEYPGQEPVVLEDDPIFPVTHYLNPWDPANPIETTITTLVRIELAQSVGFKPLDRGQVNSGEDAYFTLGCAAAGAKISHLRRKSWLWSHSDGNTSGLPGRGDYALR